MNKRQVRERHREPESEPGVRVGYGDANKRQVRERERESCIVEINVIHSFSLCFAPCSSALLHTPLTHTYVVCTYIHIPYSTSLMTPICINHPPARGGIEKRREKSKTQE